MNLEQRRHFRDELRAARLSALEDAEGFHAILAAVERLGIHLRPEGNGLAAYEPRLEAIASEAPSQAIARLHPTLLTPFQRLFQLVRRGRNEALHVGTFARHLTNHCAHLALTLEEGLMSTASCLADFMVRDPVCAAEWQPVAFARHQMLLHSFSYLPISFQGAWHWLSDHALASYLAGYSGDPRERRAALGRPIGEAVNAAGLRVNRATVLPPETTVEDAIKASDGWPVLVARPEGTVVGIATPFDLL